jgi:predicted nucleotidyltransferase component of viral defense system
LDFNYVDIEIDELIEFIENIYSVKIQDFHKTKFGSSFSIRFEGILFNGTNQSMCKLSFDFREGDIYNQPLKQIIRPIYHDLPNYFLLALSTEEILAEKVRAIVTRYKARDVFDLNELILNGVKIDFDLINKKLQTYEKIFNMEEFAEKLEEKRNIYIEEMKRLTNIFDSFDTCQKYILEQLNRGN